ncbi:hypothetical protein [[Actinomadura] parvosata]|uniref:hypothetical protein n=1 Tax=[Actinomadura] parvosata TaxID=1955412 RepID=UPI0016445EF6
MKQHVPRDERINATEEQRHVRAFSTLASLPNHYLVPPAQEVAIHQATAKIPGEALIQDSVDVEGQPVLAIARAEDGSLRQESCSIRPHTPIVADASSRWRTTRNPQTTPRPSFEGGAILSLSVRVGAGITDHQEVAQTELVTAWSNQQSLTREPNYTTPRMTRPQGTKG